MARSAESGKPFPLPDCAEEKTKVGSAEKIPPATPETDRNILPKSNAAIECLADMAEKALNCSGSSWFDKSRSFWLWSGKRSD